MDFIDEEGFRANVGIILMDRAGRVLIAGRRGRGGWQFPQGGVKPDETTESAMYRELYEEVGLEPEDVELVGQTRDWLRYRLPPKYIRRERTPVCVEIGRASCRETSQTWALPQAATRSVKRTTTSTPRAAHEPPATL